MARRPALPVIAALVFALGGARAEPVNDAAVLAAQPPKLLSEFGLFADAARQVPSDGVMPYDLNTPLFTDYALKYRFVYVPAGQAASYRETGAFDFPVGSVLVKTFAYPADMRRPDADVRLIETRLLIHQPDGWVALPYVWNDEQTEATLKLAGAKMELSWVHTDGAARAIRYSVPNKVECKGCHSVKTDGVERVAPIGPKAASLNGDHPYADGPANQLARWMSAGILAGTPSPDRAPRMPRWDDPSDGTLAERARAYLDVNCAHCHRAEGRANTSGLFLNWEEAEPVKWGVGKRPVAAGRGSGGLEFDIAPGDPDGSILLYRMDSTDPGIMMPELGRSLIHAEGVALIREWIEGLD